MSVFCLRVNVNTNPAAGAQLWRPDYIKKWKKLGNLETLYIYSSLKDVNNSSFFSSLNI